MRVKIILMSICAFFIIYYSSFLFINFERRNILQETVENNIKKEELKKYNEKVDFINFMEDKNIFFPEDIDRIYEDKLRKAKFLHLIEKNYRNNAVEFKFTAEMTTREELMVFLESYYIVSLKIEEIDGILKDEYKYMEKTGEWDRDVMDKFDSYSNYLVNVSFAL